MLSVSNRASAAGAGIRAAGAAIRTFNTVREIAEQKIGDMNAVDVDGAMAMVRGSARAMGLDVVEG